MGGFAAGFMKTVGERGRQKLDEREADDRAQKKKQADMYWDAIQSGRLDPEQLKYAQEQLQKLYPKSKGIKDVFGKIGQLAGMVHPPKGAEGAQGKDGATVSPPPGASGQPVKMPNASGGTPPFVAAQGAEPIPNAPAGARPQASPIPNAQPGAKPGGEPMQAVKPPPSFSTMVSAAHPNPEQAAAKEREDAFAAWEKQANINHKYKMEEQKAAAEAKATNPTGRASAISPISMTAARKMAEKGMEFKAADGNGPLTLDDYDDTMMLVPLQQNGKIIGYSPASQHQTHMTFNNQVVAVPSLNQMDANTIGAVQGEAKTGQKSLHYEKMTIDGKDVLVPVWTEAKPNTPGKSTGTVNPPPGATGATSATPKQPATAPGKVRQSAAPPTGEGKAPKPASSGMPKGSIVLPSGGTFAGHSMKAIQMANAVVAPAAQVFGDPEFPQFEGLAAYADLADDKDASNRIGTALQRTLDGLEAHQKEHPGVLAALKDYSGFNNLAASLQVGSVQEAISALKPREKEAYDKEMAALGTLVGLRSITGGSAALGSVKTIERESPFFGANVKNSKDFYGKLSNIALEIYEATKKIPGFDEKKREFYKEQAIQLKELSQGKKPGGSVKPPPGAGKKTADWGNNPFK